MTKKQDNRENNRENSKKEMEDIKTDRIVPDTSVIIEGLVSKKIESGEIRPKIIFIHEAVISELENQANKGRETGYIGIDELKKLREISEKYGFTIEHKGRGPDDSEIKRARLGGIDSIIRQLAEDEKATLITADQVQGLIAQSKGIPVMIIEFEKIIKKIRLEGYFDGNTMSVHLREKVIPAAKKGMPGKWDFVNVSDKELTRDEVKEMAKEIVEEAEVREDGFIEIQRKGSTIVQLGNLRIVIVRPPFSDGYEITAVRPIKKLNLPDYGLSEKLKSRIAVQAEGILIAGAPGMGKSTFAQALAEFFAAQNKIVKTVEAPRDLQLPDSITQYAISHGSPQEVHDILLLSRPDYTIFDEMRNTEDFRLFADMRLAGVGMVGVVHATKPIDAIQRFIGRIELGVIPQIVDTVIFIRDGRVSKVFNIRMDVKVPSGMTEADLARPIVTVNDFETGKLEYEVYSYGEETVVVPVKADMTSPLQSLAAESIKKEFSRYSDLVKVDVVSNNSAVVYVPEGNIAQIIGKGGQNIEFIEKKLRMHIDIQPLTKAKQGAKSNTVEFEAQVGKDNIIFFLQERDKNKDIDIIVNGDYLLTAKSSKKAIIKIKKDNKIGKIIVNSLNAGEDLRLVC